MTITPMPPAPPAGTTSAPAAAGSGKEATEDFGSLLAQLAAPAAPAPTGAAVEEPTNAAEQAAGTEGVPALVTSVVVGAHAPASGGLAEAAVRGAAAPVGPGPAAPASLDAAAVGTGVATPGSGATSVLSGQSPGAAGATGNAQQAATATTGTTTAAVEPAPEAAATTQSGGTDADLLTTPGAAGGAADGSAGQQTTGQQTQQTQAGPVGTLSSVTGATPVSPAAGTAPTAAPAGVAASPLLDQVTPVVTRMVSAGEGSHRMVLRLHPADLGEVQLTVTVRGESVDVTVAAGSDARELLAGGSGELRSLLDSIGRTAGQITFRELPGTGPLPQPALGVGTGDQPDAGQPGTSYGDLAGDRDGDDGSRGGTARAGADGTPDHGTDPEPGRNAGPSGTPGSGALDVRI